MTSNDKQYNHNHNHNLNHNLNHIHSMSSIKLEPIQAPRLDAYGDRYDVYIDHYRKYFQFVNDHNRGLAGTPPPLVTKVIDGATQAVRGTWAGTNKAIDNAAKHCAKLAARRDDVEDTPSEGDSVSLIDKEDVGSGEPNPFPRRGKPEVVFSTEGELVLKKKGKRVISTPQGEIVYPRASSPSNLAAQELLGSYLTARAFLKMRNEGKLPTTLPGIDRLKSDVQQIRFERGLTGPVDF